MKAILKNLVKILGLTSVMGAKTLSEMAYPSSVSINETSVYLPEAQPCLNSDLNSTLIPEANLATTMQSINIENITHIIYEATKKSIDVSLSSFFGSFILASILTKYFPTLPNKLKKTIDYIKRPFLTAVEQENIKVAKLSISFGADIEQVNPAGQTAHDLISRKPSTAMAAFVMNAYTADFKGRVRAVEEGNVTNSSDVLGIISGYLCPEFVQNHWTSQRTPPQMLLPFTLNKKRKNPDLDAFDKNFVPEPKKQKSEQPNNKRPSDQAANNNTALSVPAQEPSAKKRRVVVN